MSNLPKRERPWLQDLVAKRHAATVKKLTDAMKEIELDIQRNENVYPFNSGVLNQAEVCRRAGINNTQPQGASHKTTTKVMMDNWLDGVRKLNRSHNQHQESDI